MVNSTVCITVKRNQWNGDYSWALTCLWEIGHEYPSILLFNVYYQMICLTTFIEVKGTCVLQEYGDKRKLLRGLDIYGYRHWLSTLACLYCFHLHFKTERSHYSTRFLLSLNGLGHGTFQGTTVFTAHYFDA